MLMTRWQPFADVEAELNRLHDEMERVFRRVGFGDGWRGVAVYPPLNVWEDENNLYVETELPGMELNDVEIFVSGGNQLTIKGQRKAPQLEKATWHRQERGFGAFGRVVTLPVPVDANAVEARFSNGVLTIQLPKAEEVKPRRIDVKTA